MKVTESQQPPPQPARNSGPALPLGAETVGHEAAPGSGTRSFASVLDSASSPSPDEGLEPRSGEELETAKEQPPARDLEERKSPRRDELDQLPLAAPVVQLDSPIDAPDLPEPVAAREILPADDLENILLTVRTQTVAGGQPQTIIELPRSVLDGLRVKLSTDRFGRVSAEFVAKTEAVRAQVDARAPELVDMLRFRGINLATLKSSVSADLSGGNDSSRGHSHAAVEAAAATGNAAAGDPGFSPDVSRQESDPGDTFTYRA